MTDSFEPVSDAVPSADLPAYSGGPARKTRLNPLIGTARNALRESVQDLSGGTLLVACSGGADSLALAAVARFFARRGQYQVGGVVVDHGLQGETAAVAARTAQVLTDLGLAPVQVRRVRVDDAGSGPEAAARTARYAALDAAAAELGAAAVLLGHTLDDQAEQVLLGLARGSGTRSLSGMPARRGLYRRPFLGLRRADTEEICALEGLEPWHDPTNADPAFARSRVRRQVLPFIEEQLGPGVAEALYRSSRILAADADCLDGLAAEKYALLRRSEADGVSLGQAELRELPSALRHRVLALAAVDSGGDNPSFERLLAVESLLKRQGSAGPVQLSGHVSVHRETREQAVKRDGVRNGRLVFTDSRQA